MGGEGEGVGSSKKRCSDRSTLGFVSESVVISLPQTGVPGRRRGDARETTAGSTVDSCLP